jgi:uncharacterized membrane protein YkoI
MDELLEIKKEATKAMNNSDSYLTSFLCQLDGNSMDTRWIIHFYDPIHDTMFSFDNETKEVQGPLEIFKEQDFVPELDLDTVHIEFEEAIKLAIENALPAKDFKKTVVVLQTIEDVPVWNITLLAATFHALNIRIDARDGDILRKEPIELFDWKSKEK